MTLAHRLTPFMHVIAKDIRECGSACDTILKKGFLGELYTFPFSSFRLTCVFCLLTAKTIKSTIYENRLAEFSRIFIEHRKYLFLQLSLHSSLGVDNANQKLDTQGDRLRAIEKKINIMLLFRKLDTPREKDVIKFIEDSGGAKACIANDELLEELVSRSGESLSRFPAGRDHSGRRSTELPDMKKKLMKELQEDIDEAFNRNMVLFERKLDIQSKQLAETMQEESEHIITTLLAGAHDRISDPVYFFHCDVGISDLINLLF